MESRRSANYGSSVWDDNYVQSLTTPYTAQKWLTKWEELKDEVKIIMDETTDEMDQLELVDNLLRLHISDHLKDRVDRILEGVNRSRGSCPENDLYFTALKFRLLRQHGYHVPQEIFCSFMDSEGTFKGMLGDDVEGLLSLYEASFLSVEGETIMDLARDFSSHRLKERLDRITDPILAKQVRHALEIPLHWRVQRLEAKWFIPVYESRLDANPTLLQFAKLDFNMVQSIYQDEMKSLSKWYEETGLVEKLRFARHRLAECYFWALGFVPDPHRGYSREILTKVAVFITIADDMYDVYGTLDELKAFTETIERWDINALNELPEYMQIFFLALFNSTNEIGYHFLRDQGFNVIPNLRKLWAELSRAYYQEAKWFHTGYFPTTDEYLSEAWISISGPLLLFYAYFSITNPISKDEVESLDKYPGIIRWPSMVLRLADDLGTSSDEIKRGDVPKCRECYMRETGCSAEEGQEYAKHLIEELLRRMNKEILMDKCFKNFGQTAMNLARISLCYYEKGDGFGVPYKDTKMNLVSLIVEPIPMPMP